MTDQWLTTFPTVEEGQIPTVTRINTGLWSFDKAVSNIETGMPLRTIIELYGNEHTGKSSLAFFLAARVKKTGRVGIMDTEGALDPNYLETTFGRAGFEGTMKVVDYAKLKKKEKVQRPHEEMAQELADYLLDDDFNAIIIDSLGMWRPVAEAEGDLGDAIMGRRAKAIAQFARRCASHLIIIDDPKVVFLVNHRLAGLSTRGHYTPGGKTKSYASNVRLFMYRYDNDFKDGCFQAEIKVEKLRWGGTHKEKKGQVFIIPGVGVAPGMTAMLDCCRLGLATRGAVVKYKATKSGETVWNSAGRIGTLIDAEREGNMKKFTPFLKILKEVRDGKARLES